MMTIDIFKSTKKLEWMWHISRVTADFLRQLSGTMVSTVQLCAILNSNCCMNDRILILAHIAASKPQTPHKTLTYTPQNLHESFLV